MKAAWKIDDAHHVTARMHPITGRITVAYNERTVFDAINWRLRRVIPFTLDDGRGAQVEMKVLGTFQPGFRLEVQGTPIPLSDGGVPACPSCDHTVSTQDEFCEACGARLDPRALFEHAERSKAIREATSAIRALVFLFVVSGLLLFVLSAGEADAALATLSEYPADMVWPEPVYGEQLTVEALRDTVLWEKWSVLVINLGLAATMAGIAWWSRKAPLPAILTAGAIYLVVQVLNAIADPMTLAQGVILKIIVLTVLAKGLKAALAARRVPG